MANNGTINPNSFGSPRTRAWAQKIADRQKNNPGLAGMEKAGKNHGNSEVHKELKNDVRNTNPGPSGKYTMNQQANLGSGKWSAVG